MIPELRFLKESTESPDIKHRGWACLPFSIFLVAQINLSTPFTYASITPYTDHSDPVAELSTYFTIVK